MTSSTEQHERDVRVSNFKRSMKSNLWLFVSTALYLLTRYLLQEHPGGTPIGRVLITFLPLGPGLVYLWTLWGTFQRLDELERRIQLEAWAFALGGTVLVSMGLNVLNAHGLGFERFPHGLEIGGTYLSVFFFWCLGVAQAQARYR